MNQNQDPLKAICYIEGYMQHLLKMQGETMDEELNNRFKTIHEFINASQVVNVCSASLKMIEDQHLQRAILQIAEREKHLNSIA